MFLIIASFCSRLRDIAVYATIDKQTYRDFHKWILSRPFTKQLLMPQSPWFDDFVLYNWIDRYELKQQPGMVEHSPETDAHFQLWCRLQKTFELECLHIDHMRFGYFQCFDKKGFLAWWRRKGGAQIITRLLSTIVIRPIWIRFERDRFHFCNSSNVLDLTISDTRLQRHSRFLLVTDIWQIDPICPVISTSRSCRERLVGNCRRETS